ncbi:MAG: hypothetical protein ACI36X_03060 [Bacteroidaceae bacterium]
MKTYRTILTAALLLILGGGCSSDGDNPSASPAHADKPNWSIDLTGNEARPAWEVPSYADYQVNMTALPRLSPALEQLAGDDDRMAAFIDGECRAVVNAWKSEENGHVYFPLFIYNNAGSSQQVTLKYYNSRFSCLFTLENAFVFHSDEMLGFDNNDFVPALESGGKFPAYAPVTISLTDDARPFVLHADDELAAFAGSECRSVHWVEDGKHRLGIFGREGETIHLQYYSGEKQGIYRSNETFTMKNGTDLTLQPSWQPVTK